MNEEQNLKKLEQEAFRELMQDGFTEMMAGMIFIFFPLIIAESSFMVIFVVFYILFLPQIFNQIREKFVYPRIGYVKLREEEPPKVTARIVAIIILMITGGILLLYAISIELITSELVYRWVPAFFGLIMWAPSFYLVDKTGQKRYFLFGALMTITGLAVSLVNFLPVESTTVTFGLVWGVAFLAVGIIRFGLFIRKYPLIDTPEGENSE